MPSRRDVERMAENLYGRSMRDIDDFLSRYGYLESAALDRQRYLAGLTDEAYERLRQQPGYTPEEAWQILREYEFPESREYDYLEPSLSGLSRIGQEYSERLGRSYNIGAEGMDLGFDIAQRGYREAIDPSRLRLSSRFLPDIVSASDVLERRQQEALASPYLEFSPEAQAAMIRQAAADVAARGRAQQAQLSRQAAEAGMRPEGLAALRARIGQYTAAEEADQMLRARVAAEQEAARRAIEAAGLRTTAASEAARSRIGALTTAEQLRLGSEQDLASRLAERSRYLSSLASERGRYLGERYGDIASQLERAATAAGRYELEQRLGQSERDWQRQMLRNQLLSQRYRDIAEARRQGEREYRTGSGERERYYGGQAVDWAGRRIQGYGTAGELASSSVRTRAGLQEQRRGALGTIGSIIGIGSQIGRAIVGGGG